jgi:hypothetical protein
MPPSLQSGGAECEHDDAQVDQAIKKYLESDDILSLQFVSKPRDEQEGNLAPDEEWL